MATIGSKKISAMAVDKSGSGMFDRASPVLSYRTKTELVAYVDALFQREGSMAELGVDPRRMRVFIEEVSRRYRANPYHNFHHATDTINTVCWLVSRPVFRNKLPLHHRFLLLFTALIHDVEHPGHNNQWEVQVDSPLAREYKNEAVLENHSFQVTLRILADPAYDLFQPFGKETAQRWLKIVEELVLATDFAVHRRFMDEFGRFLASHPVDYADPTFLSWVSRALIKAADIANTSKPFPQAMVWGQRVMMEFWAQGVLEKQRNYPIGPLNDPETVQLNAAQAGFIRFAVLELFEQLHRLEPGIGELVENLRANLTIYEGKARAGDLSFE